MESFIGVGRIYLIGFFVVVFYICSGVDGFMKWIVVCRCVFSRISYNICIDVICFFKCFLDIVNVFIYYVRRCNNISVSFSMW